MPSASYLAGGRTGLQTNPHAIDAAFGGFQHFETQSVLLEDFNRLGDVSGELAYQPGNGGRLFFVGPHAQQLFQQVHIGVAVEDVRGLALLHDLSLFVLVADLANDFLHQVFDGDQAGDSAVLVDDDGHANVVALHLAHQLAAQLGFGDKVHIGLHQVAYGLGARVRVEDLQEVLGIDNAFDMVDIAFIDRYARIGIPLYQFGEILDGGVDGHRDDLGPGPHHFAHRLVAEFDHRLDKIAVALLQNALFLTGFDQRVHGLRGMFGLRSSMFLGERCDRQSEAEDQGHRHGEINERPQNRDPSHQPLASGAHEKKIRQQTVEDDDDEDETHRRLHQIEHDPARFHEQHVADEHANAGHAHLGQHGHRERSPFAAYVQPGLDVMLVGVYVLLELPPQKLSHLRVQPVHVGHQSQQRHQDHQKDGQRQAHLRPPPRLLEPADLADGFRPGELFSGLLWVRSISPTGKPSLRRRAVSRVCISPSSVSWSEPARCNNPCRDRKSVGCLK